MIQNRFAHTHRLWCYLYQLVALDVLQALLKTHYGLWNNASLIISTRCTYVSKLLSLTYVYYQVVIVNMLTNYLTHVNILTWIDEELTTVLQLIDSISKGVTSIHRYHRTIYTALNLALVWLILLKAVGHDSLALTGRKHIGTQSDDSA